VFYVCMLGVFGFFGVLFFYKCLVLEAEDSSGVFVAEEFLPCYSLVGVFWWGYHSLVWVFACFWSRLVCFHGFIEKSVIQLWISGLCPPLAKSYLRLGFVCVRL
jgi:hypothetical protein